MSGYVFTDRKGSFTLDYPEHTGYLYFPIAGDNGVKSSVTPVLGGDSKTDQNHFLLQPVSAEELHNNKSTRNFWCRVEGKGCWSATGADAEAMSHRFTAEEDKSELEAGIMWHRRKRRSKRYGLASEILSFVPSGVHQTELMHVTIENTGDAPCVFEAVAAVPMYGRSADNIRDHRHVTSLLNRIRTTRESVVLRPTLSFDERGHRINDRMYYVGAVTGEGNAPARFYPVAEEFIGEGGSFERPEAVFARLQGVEAGYETAGYEAMGACGFAPVELKPGEKAAYIVLIGTAETDAGIEAAVEAYSDTGKVMEAYEETRIYWLDRINVSYQTGDTVFDNFMYWVNFQPVLRRIYGCSFLPHHDYGKGGRGWRDLWQDCLALLIMNPSGVREMLLDNFNGVRADGTNATIIGARPGEFIADRNNITRVWMDHGVWPLITTGLYIDQTGDLSILLKEIPYFKDKQAARGTAVDEAYAEEQETVQKDRNGRKYYGTVLEHLLVQNLTCFYEVGEHNHMRLRGADWNDALDMAPERGESVAFTAAYAGNLEKLADLIEELEREKRLQFIELASEMELLLMDDPAIYEDAAGKRALLDLYCKSCIHELSGEKCYVPVHEAVTSLRSKADWLKAHIRREEWIAGDNGEGWFNSYYDNNGRKVEGRTEQGVRMMLTGQVFTIMSGTADREQIEAITRSADRYLYDETAGGYRLNTDFGELKTDLGRMFGFAYGHKENGAVFSHMTTMYANALYDAGFASEGYKALHTLYRQAVNFEKSRIYPGIPEYFNDKGRGMYHYLTGAASWLMLTVITQMFGVKGRYGDLCLEPKLMAEQFDEEGRAGIYLYFRGKKWHIVYVNQDRKEYGSYRVKEFYLDGRRCSLPETAVAVTGEQIKTLNDTVEHEIIAKCE